MGEFFNYYRGGSTVAKVHGWWPAFTGQHTNARRNARRAKIKAAGGIRQFKIQKRKASHG